MRTRYASAGSRSERSGRFRDQSGLAVSTLLAVLGVAIGFWGYYHKSFVRDTSGKLQQLAQDQTGVTDINTTTCLKTLISDLDTLQTKARNDPSVKAAILPDDAPEVKRFRDCEELLKKLRESVQLKNALENSFGQNFQTPDDLFSVVTTCEMVSLGRGLGIAGQAFTLTGEARIAFERKSSGTPVGSVPAGQSSAEMIIDLPGKRSVMVPLGDGFRRAGSFNFGPADASSIVFPEGSDTVATQVHAVGASKASNPPLDKDDVDRACATGNNLSFTWKKPDPPVIESFGVSPREIEKGSNASVQLAWVIKNASHVSIDQGIGVVNPKTGFQPVIPTPQESTTYTITAIGLVPGLPQVSRSDTLVVKEPDKPATVAISSPSEGDEITDNGVTVSGVVVPVPDEAHRKAQILVNGAFLSEAVINGSGQFSTRTALQRTLTIGNIHVFGEGSVTVRSCGPRLSPIGVAAIMDGGARNLIRVVVPLANGQQASASVQVDHVAVVNNFSVNWFGCPPDNKDLARNVTLRANADAVHIGDVSCGVEHTSGPFGCVGGANISIQTTGLGTKQVTQPWDINVDKECP